jgi:hypothetical protein
MRRTIIVIVAVVALGVLGVASLTFIRLKSPVRHVLSLDARNVGIDVDVHYEAYVNTSTLVFNLTSVSPSNSMADVFRTVLQTASALKDQEFTFVRLECRNKPNFLLKGTYFKTLGAEYETQNPVYTTRTFAQNVYKLDGTAAYPEWSGGLLGVLGQQMEDFSDFHRHWYLEQMSSTTE